jgi:hypothetical protein
MAVSLIVLVFIESQDPAGSLPVMLMQRAAEEGLGARASVSVRPVAPGTPDDVLLDLARQQAAGVVARVVWRNPQHLAARLDVTLMEDGRTISRPLIFQRSDPPHERWRALGLVLASTLGKALEIPFAEPASNAPAASLMAGDSPVPAPPRWALDAAAQGSFGIGGTAARAGGSIGVRWLHSRRVGFRLGAHARFGDMNAAQATMLTLAASAGVIWEVRRPPADRGLGFSLRADALVLYETMSHLSSDDAARVRQARVLPGGSLTAELRWSLSPTLALVFAAGPEVAWGTTRVYVGNVEVGDVSPLRATIQAGLIAGF